MESFGLCLGALLLLLLPLQLLLRLWLRLWQLLLPRVVRVGNARYGREAVLRGIFTLILLGRHIRYHDRGHIIADARDN